ncbi:endonuclease/exonuclease/phosphatase family protein [Halovulum sp. GXIMD14793]
MTRIATWNVAWFAELFSRNDKLLRDDEWSRLYNTTRKDQADAIAQVLRAVDADLFVIVEAPNTGNTQSTSCALGNFADHYNLRQTHALIGFESETHQEIAAFYDPTRVSVQHDPKGGLTGHAPRFDQSFDLDIDVDAQPEQHVFSKPPLELQLDPVGGQPLRLIGVHAKSKMARNAPTPEAAHQMAIANRRKKLAQCIWLRQRVDQHLAAGDDLIVLGDFNDGPGLDSFEKLFERSGVEVVLGDPDTPETLLRDPFSRAWLEGTRTAQAATARFYDKPTHRYINTLIDFIMLSPALAERSQPKWRIWHPFDDADCFEDKALQKALLTASDHFPVSVDLALAPGDNAAS